MSSKFDEELLPYVPFNLSFFDLMQIEAFKNAVVNNNTQEMNKVLWENGVDINRPYEIVECTHRPLTRKEPWTGPMVQGMERLDQTWVKSGYASFEAQIEMHQEKDYLKQISRRSNTTAAEISKAKAEKKYIDKQLAG